MATLKKPKGLGMGLEALLGPRAPDSRADDQLPSSLPLNQLHAGKYQPRTRMDEGSLYELRDAAHPGAAAGCRGLRAHRR